MASFQPPGYCPTCGDYVQGGQDACPSCGSCHRTGWSEEAEYDGLDLPESHYEQDSECPRGPSGLSALAAAALLALLIYAFILR